MPLKIAFATTQSTAGSTLLGRILPLAEHLSAAYNVHLLHLNKADKQPPNTIKLHRVGREPFSRAPSGKRRLTGFFLIFNQLSTALFTALALSSIHPDIVIISKPLPANSLGVLLWHIFTRVIHTFNPNYSPRIILDVDDFELTANVTSSLYQRFAIHWSERTSARLAGLIVTASPFLSDHFLQLTNNSIPVKLIPTGISAVKNPSLADKANPQLLYLGSVSKSSGHSVDLLPVILNIVHKTYPQTILTIAGSGDDIASLKKSFMRLGLSKKVVWRGRFTFNGITKFIASNTIIIDPIDASISNRAKSSFRVSLAMKLGLPVVTSNVGIRPRLIPRQLHRRLFAQPASSKDYANKIIGLISTPLSVVEKNAMSRHNIQFTWPRVASDYQALIKRFSA